MDSLAYANLKVQLLAECRGVTSFVHTRVMVSQQHIQSLRRPTSARGAALIGMPAMQCMRCMIRRGNGLEGAGAYVLSIMQACRALELEGDLQQFNRVCVWVQKQ